MTNHPIEGFMKTTMEHISKMVDANTIIGKAVTSPDGSIIIPVSKVSFGFAAGGSDYSTSAYSANSMFGGGCGGGVSITPVAFLIVNQQQIRSIPLENSSHILDRLLDTAPKIMEKMFGAQRSDQTNSSAQHSLVGAT